MVCVQNEDAIHGTRENWIDFVFLAWNREAHVQKVRRVIEFIARIDERLPNRIFVGHGGDCRHLGDHADACNLALPGIDGWEATRRLKADPRTTHIPVIALSGQVLPRHAEEARRAGCAAVLLKPILPEVLVAEVRRVLPTGARD